MILMSRSFRSPLASRRLRALGAAALVALAALNTACDDSPTAPSEGAVVMARAERSLEPFDLVADELVDQVRAARSGDR